MPTTNIHTIKIISLNIKMPYTLTSAGIDGFQPSTSGSVPAL